MVFIILGAIVLLLGRSFLAKNPQFGKSQSVVYFSAGILILLGLSTSVFKMIDAGQVGVQSMFGKVSQTTLPSGMNVINPLMDVTLFDIKTQNYTMSGVHDEGDKNGDDAIRVLTSDGLEVIVDLTVLFKILPSDISHYQIIDEGINFALTVHGTIGAEYAYLGIPVINAGLNNPHIGYDFNIHAADVKSYEKILCNLESKLSIDLDKDAIHEFYYMRNIYNSSKLYFQDYDKFNFEIGGYKKQFSPKVYRYWIENAFDIDRHKFILQKYANFIASNDKTMRI
jgi:hypothetical protein